MNSIRIPIPRRSGVGKSWGQIEVEANLTGAGQAAKFIRARTFRSHDNHDRGGCVYNDFCDKSFAAPHLPSTHSRRNVPRDCIVVARAALQIIRTCTAGETVIAVAAK